MQLLHKGTVDVDTEFDGHQLVQTKRVCRLEKGQMEESSFSFFLLYNELNKAITHNIFFSGLLG